MGNLVHNQRKGQIFFSSGTKQVYHNSKNVIISPLKKRVSQKLSILLSEKQSTN